MRIAYQKEREVQKFLKEIDFCIGVWYHCGNGAMGFSVLRFGYALFYFTDRSCKIMEKSSLY